MTTPIQKPITAGHSASKRQSSMLSKKWAQQLHRSQRTFNRLFRQQTGMSFGVWRQQACLMAALPRLLSGSSVTRTALGGRDDRLLLTRRTAP